jgi:DNA-binding MarR family transcriptional regulator
MAGMTRWLDASEEQVWRDFLQVQRRLEVSTGQQLAASGLSTSDFAVLVVLSDVPEGRRRAFELGRELQWEKSRLSHHLTRMQRRGLVLREDCGSDRRGAYIALTDVGRTALEAAAPGHVEHVRSRVFDVLSASQVEALGEICTALLASLPPSPPPAPAQECCSPDQ